MRVVVDRDLCEANGVCAGLAPGLFDLDDEDYLHISPGEVPAESADVVRRAVASCPRLALSLADCASRLAKPVRARRSGSEHAGPGQSTPAGVRAGRPPARRRPRPG